MCVLLEFYVHPFRFLSWMRPANQSEIGYSLTQTVSYWWLDLAAADVGPKARQSHKKGQGMKAGREEKRKEETRTDDRRRKVNPREERQRAGRREICEGKG